MKIEKLRKGDTIGLVSPSHVEKPEKHNNIISKIKAKGFQVKIGANIYKDTYGYLASEEERADDFNQMVLDKNIKMVFFRGGNGGVEILPYIDYEAIKQNPKIFLSYSDGTSILNAIHSKTGLITYYGQDPNCFEDLRHYDYEQFDSHFIKGNAKDFVSNSKWHTLHNGICEGTLIGGYTENFALMVNTEYLVVNNQRKYLLFLEDFEENSDARRVSMFISCIEQSPFINNVSGLMFGSFSEIVNIDLMASLKRFGEKHNLPVIYCDDFGHGKNHAILPIGMNAKLNADIQTLEFFNCN
jgi:muramoyltetrapeptide carboxypeptidase